MSFTERPHKFIRLHQHDHLPKTIVLLYDQRHDWLRFSCSDCTFLSMMKKGSIYKVNIVKSLLDENIYWEMNLHVLPVLWLKILLSGLKERQ